MLAQSEQIDEIVHLCGRGAVRKVPEAVDNVFVCIEIRKERVVLKDDVEAALFHRHMREILAVEENAPGRRIREAEHEIEERRFAAARRPENGDDLALVDRERNVFEDSFGAVRLAYVVELKHRSLRE